MKRSYKISINVLSILIAMLAVFDASLLKVHYWNPFHPEQKVITLKNAAIPESLNGLRAVYISDLEINDYMDADLINKIFDPIIASNPDLFFFGGDLIAADASLSPEMEALITEKLSAIQAPSGKFAVYGEQDLISPARVDQVKAIYKNSQIEVLGNQSVILAADSSGLQLTGLMPDTNPADAFADPSMPTLVLSHYPDLLLDSGISSNAILFALAGNAHGTQIQWPIYGGYKIWPGSQKLNRADERKLPFDYYLTSGVGCLNIQSRMNAPVQVISINFLSSGS